MILLMNSSRKRISEDGHFLYLVNMIFKRKYGAPVILISSMGPGPKATVNRNILFLRTDCLLFTEKRPGERTIGVPFVVKMAMRHSRWLRYRQMIFHRW